MSPNRLYDCPFLIDRTENPEKSFIFEVGEKFLIGEHEYSLVWYSQSQSLGISRRLRFSGRVFSQVKNWGKISWHRATLEDFFEDIIPDFKDWVIWNLDLFRVQRE